MAIFYRRDDWVQSAIGNAISGAGVYVTSQPSNPAKITKGKFIPPSPLVQLYADPAGLTPIQQPVQTDGFGHAEYYVAFGTYTVTIYSPQIGIITLPDQFIGGSPLPVNATTPLGIINGSNTVFTISSAPSTFLMLFLNGVLQLPSGVNYSIAGNTITMVTAPQTGDQLWVLYQ
jgi:hypothetical protein